MKAIDLGRFSGSLSYASCFVVFLAGFGSGSPANAESLLQALVSTKNETLATVPFITVRNKTGKAKPSKYFGDSRGNRRAGYCDISRTTIDTLESIAAKIPFSIPDEYAKLEAVREVPLDDFWKRAKKSTNRKLPVLYTHGFFISFNKGCKRASLFQESLGLEGRLVLFSWPSDGAILNYTRDEADLYWSVAPLEATIRDMIRRFGAGKFDIAAHSLGARGTFFALVALARERRGNRPLVNQVVLLAPDIDAGVFRQYLPLIRPLARNITIYVTDSDRALALSAQVHGYPRLGESGPHLRKLGGIEIIDLSALPARSPSGHVYHLNDDTVIGDLDQLLNEGKRASERRNLEPAGDGYWRMKPEADN